MYTNPLSFIRKARVLSTLLVAIMTNTIVFAEPISHALHNFSSHSEYEKSFSQNNSYTNTATIAKGSKEVNKIEREAKENSLLIGRVATYSAKENFGEIGVDSSINADYVHDNYFTVSIPDLSVYENYIAVLSYDLYGVDAKGATKSINNKVAYGGKHYQKDATWKNVEEYLPIDLLQSGENEIFFNRYKDEAYSYEVKNVQINFQPYLNKSLQESKNDIEKQWEEATINSINYGNTHIESSAYFKTAIAEDESVSKNIVIGLHFKDLKPLPKQLHNVTKGEYLGYRWVTNASEGTIEMQYEDFAIPAGYTEKDVKIYYFDSASRKWSPLPKIAHDYESNTIVAEIIENSSSETDYINGVITNPENPEVAAFAPTQISDMEFANPTDGVVSISPPQANSKGVANTSFPIKLPAGRNGMQPNISIDYSSEGGNGWLGKGWDLTMSNISVNTKWGVPRYDGLYESEVYSLDGQDLVLKVTDSLDNIEYTNAHRKENISRNQGSFHLRKEGAYIEVKRHGSNPQNYWWEITDANGYKSYYGGVNRLDRDAVLSATSNGGNIAKWALVRTEDPYGNYIEYTYFRQRVQIKPGVYSQEFYPKKITYTRHSDLSNYYEIEFIRDLYSAPITQIPYTRSDISTNGRFGFLTSTYSLLRQIDVRYVENSISQPVRYYTLHYNYDTYGHSLLNEIAEYDSDKKLFYSNTMEYYDEIVGHNTINDDSESWDIDEAKIKPPVYYLVNPALRGLLSSGSSLGASESYGFSAAGRFGVGIGTNPSNIWNTLGFGFNYSQNNQETKIDFIDINGDGLPDKIIVSLRATTSLSFL